MFKKLTAQSWSDLRRFGTNPVLKTSYFWFVAVPIMAKVLRQIEQPLTVPFLGKFHIITFDLPFSWYSFYFSAVAFAVASALFGVYCPQIIKRYTSFGEFYDEKNGPRALLEHYWSLPTEARFESLGDFDQELGFLEHPRQQQSPTEIDFALATAIRQMRPERMPGVFSVIYSCSDATRPRTRGTIALLYVVGFLLLAWVAFENFCWVFRTLWR